MVAGAAFAAGEHRRGQLHDLRRLRRQPDRGLLERLDQREVPGNSYPALIYRQATGKTTGFEQPLVSAPGLPGALRLTGLFPTVISPTPGAGQPINLNLPRPYNNMAVPGATLHDLLTKTTSTSASDPTDLVLRRLGATQLQQGLSLQADLRHASGSATTTPWPPPPPASPSRG